MTKKQCIMIAIISAILTGVFMYLVYYFPRELVDCLFWIVSTVFCFVCFYLLIALIWTKGEILPNTYPSYYLPDPDINLGDIKKEKTNER